MCDFSMLQIPSGPSEVLELCVKGGRVSHSWCMCVVSYGYGGFGGGWDGSGGEKYAGQSQEGSVACQEMPEYFQSAR